MAMEPESVTEHRISRRVLIADDNIDAAATLEMLLQMLGHVTFVAHDGLAALEGAERFRPEVVILDIGMPRLNGYETLKRMKDRPWAVATTFIALTGWGQESDRQAAATGFHHHLLKPVDPNVLETLLK